MNYINTEKFSKTLREKGYKKDSEEFLITNFKDSLQENDITRGANCNGFGRVHHFRRYLTNDWPQNPLPIDPACHALNIPRTDLLEVQLFQNSICSWRCWYCFVDEKLLNGDKRYARYMSVNELIQLYLHEKDSPKVIDISGGQPDLIPEWTLHFLKNLQELRKKKQIYIWSDDNLSNEYLWKYLTKSELNYLCSAENYGRVGCFKGFDKNSFSFNTRAEPELFNKQFKIMQRLVQAGFDVYGYVTLTTNNLDNVFNLVNSFIDRLQTEIHPIFPLRVIPLQILEFSPTKSRLNEITKYALETQYEVVCYWQEILSKRFSKKELENSIHLHKLH
ncbi:MAG: hypothetical protein Q8N03_05765 [Ignavibacteria bacterium]|nr:hypothetical protein [Ignavibacteria bacterium]